MKGIKLEEFEKELKTLKFKKIYLEDESGHWFEKLFKYKDLEMCIVVEPDYKNLSLEVKTGEFFSNKVKMHGYYDTVKLFKCTLPNVKMLLKRYKNGK